MFCRSKNENVLDLFDSEHGRPIFRAIMMKETFQYVNKFLRFDDFYGRRQQKSADKFAPIRDLFERWSEILPNFYNPHECVTIDEQWLDFHGRSHKRYGLKFWRAVCARTCYVWKIQPFLGQTSDASDDGFGQRQSERVVLDLVDGLKGHNITMDERFSSYELGQQLLLRNITMVGTMRQTDHSIPPILRECDQKPLYQSTFAFTRNTTLVSYIAKKNNCVIVQSTLHRKNSVRPDGKKVPEIIEYYNRTKGLLKLSE